VKTEAARRVDLAPPGWRAQKISIDREAASDEIIGIVRAAIFCSWSLLISGLITRESVFCFAEYEM
jgi:hypothetical protein